MYRIKGILGKLGKLRDFIPKTPAPDAISPSTFLIPNPSFLILFAYCLMIRQDKPVSY
jgi:hypothetical protein